ncbi:hypothetical protein GGI03_000050 [Coemansia sp. RSA 2337]|nr:hypothetical protein IW146_007401 [Coemansia sp. RSA 922]KAJ2469912.1 hypothetical protein GGI03_000050 [Coemansia sp. RSA 2337]
MATLADINIEELHTFKRKQLQTLCKKHGVKANGKSEEIIERLIECINNGGSDHVSNDTDDSDDDQRYDSAAEESKSSTLPADGIATPEKLFKVVPLLATEPMDAPESITVVEPAQFASQVEKFTAQLEARAAAIAAEMGKEDIEKYNPAYGLVRTPRSKTATKTIAFDKAHDKLFSSGDSIANHWSAKKVTATPKRVNEDVVDSNKRPRVEVLFKSPSVQPQSARAKRKSTRGKSMTAKSQRTAAPGASLDGSKTVVVDSRVQSTGDAAVLSSTILFGPPPTTPVSKAADVDFAPLVDAAASVKIDSEPVSTIFSPKKSRGAKKPDTVALLSPAKSALKAKTPATPKTAATPTRPAATPAKAVATPARTVATPAKPAATPKTAATPAKTTATPAKTAATPAKTAATPAKTAATPAKAAATPARTVATPAKTAATPAKPAATPAKSAATPKTAATPSVVKPVAPAAAVQVDVVKPAAPIVAPKTESSLPKAKPDAAVPTKPSVPKESAAPVAKPSQIPMARKIAKPRSVAALVASKNAPKKAAVESKIQAPKKPEVVKPAPKQAVTKPDSAPTTATTKPLTTQPAGVRNVESKLKSYINSKPPPPKVKAVKPSVPDPKSMAKPNVVTVKPIKSVPAPAASTAAKDLASKDLPNYMRPTRTKEIRSQKATAKVLPKPEPGKLAKPVDGKARFNPYNRPAKPVAAKHSAAK